MKGLSCHNMTRSHASTYYDFNQWQIHQAIYHKKYINTVQNERKEKIISQCIILDKQNGLLSTTCIYSSGAKSKGLVVWCDYLQVGESLWGLNAIFKGIL